MMDPLIPRRHGSQGPEAKIQTAIMNYLRAREWFVRHLHGSAFQSGFPDLWACNSKYGHRWIEVKLPMMKGSKFTGAQLDVFPKLCANGSGVWVLTAATEEEYLKLWAKPNWYIYMGVLK